MTIHLQPIGVVDQDVLNFLKLRLSALWAVVENSPVEVPDDAYNGFRNQYEGLKALISIPDMDEPVLGIIDQDIFAENLNFIFGIASGNRALISLRRLRPEFYGGQKDQELFHLRALKEAMHELGHVFGLKHCSDPGCVMHFSNSIEDTDIKDWRYCRWCGGSPPGV